MSYNIRNQKWGDPTRGTESGEIEWSMDLSSGLTPASGYSIADLEGAMQSAFDRWEEVADIDFTYVGSSGGDITVDMAPLSGSTVGLASWSFSGSVILSGDIDMDSNETWSPFGGGGGTNFYAVALHEIGHVIGFNHVNDTSEIMNGYISTNDLGDGDIAGAQVLYGSGGAAPPPADPSDDPPPSSFSPSSDSDSGSGAGAAILGLLALIAGLVFGLGGGAAFAAAAMTKGPEDDEDEAERDDDVADDVLLTDLVPPVEGFAQHAVYLTEADLIAAEGEDWADHDHDHGACGCAGPCDCHAGETRSDEVLLTDLIPVTGVLSEHACGLELPDEDEDLLEDDLLFA